MQEMMLLHGRSKYNFDWRSEEKQKKFDLTSFQEGAILQKAAK